MKPRILLDDEDRKVIIKVDGMEDFVFGYDNPYLEAYIEGLNVDHLTPKQRRNYFVLPIT